MMLLLVHVGISAYAAWRNAMQVTTQIVRAREVQPAAWWQFIAGTDGIAAQVRRNLYKFWRV